MCRISANKSQISYYHNPILNMLLKFLLFCHKLISAQSLCGVCRVLLWAASPEQSPPSRVVGGWGLLKFLILKVLGYINSPSCNVRFYDDGHLILNNNFWDWRCIFEFHNLPIVFLWSYWTEWCFSLRIAAMLADSVPNFKAKCETQFLAGFTQRIFSST